MTQAVEDPLYRWGEVQESFLRAFGTQRNVINATDWPVANRTFQEGNRSMTTTAEIQKQAQIETYRGIFLQSARNAIAAREAGQDDQRHLDLFDISCEQLQRMGANELTEEMQEISDRLCGKSNSNRELWNELVDLLESQSER